MIAQNENNSTVKIFQITVVKELEKPLSCNYLFVIEYIS